MIIIIRLTKNQKPKVRNTVSMIWDCSFSSPLVYILLGRVFWGTLFCLQWGIATGSETKMLKPSVLSSRDRGAIFFKL